MKIRQMFCSLVIAFALSACSSVSKDGKEWVGEEEAEDVQTTSQALDNSNHKICSAVAPGNYRDTLVVRNDWTKELCRRFAVSTATPQYALGCMFLPIPVTGQDGISWGATVATSNTNAPAPSNNSCGW